MRFSFRYQDNDYIEAQDLHAPHRKGLRWSLPLMALIGISLILYHGVRLYHTYFGHEQYYFSLLYLLLGLFLLVFPLVSTREFRKGLQSYTDLIHEFVLEIDDRGIKYSGGGQLLEWSWEAIAGWREGETLFLFYVGPNVFVMLPKRVLGPGDIKKIRALLYDRLS